MSEWENAVSIEALAQISLRQIAMRWWRTGDLVERQAALLELGKACEVLDHAEKARRALGSERP
jgi:hypothetical protein